MSEKDHLTVLKIRGYTLDKAQRTIHVTQQEYDEDGAYVKIMKDLKDKYKWNIQLQIG